MTRPLSVERRRSCGEMLPCALISNLRSEEEHLCPPDFLHAITPIQNELRQAGISATRCNSLPSLVLGVAIMTARTLFRTAAPELTDSQIKAIFVNRDELFNRVILAALLYGIYTGVVAVTLCAVASRNYDQNYRRPHFLVFIILLLYILAIFNLYYKWAGEISTFITNGTNFWIGYTSTPSPPILLTAGISAILSTNLADATLHKKTLASRGIVAYYSAFGPIENLPPQAFYLENIVNWAVLYSSLILATLLWCTILIVYRILRVGGAAGRMHVYQRVIEMLVESALLYAAVIVVLLVFQVHNENSAHYVVELANAIRGIAPTMLVGRVAAGHARPDDSWSENTSTSSLRFRSSPDSHNDGEISVGSGWDTYSRARPDLEEGLEENTRS
ncbi:hypothetical protein EV421DRAFT_2022477 [Armillaria borealis]|uniref:Uncharacterized protein n=1 Tax=Armillaria borealis TaxID=47425 RepID=A0AA39J4M6_9AGAR|nr:hypothetical protein EV421DRAFT_2022477 [Armillaria borealis]